MHFYQQTVRSFIFLSSVEGRSSLEELTSTIQATFHEDYGDVDRDELKEALRAFLEVTLPRNKSRLEEARLEELPSDDTTTTPKETTVAVATKATKTTVETSSKEDSTAPKDSSTTKDEDKSTVVAGDDKKTTPSYTKESELVTSKLTTKEVDAMTNRVVRVVRGVVFVVVMFPKPAKFLWQLFVCSFCVYMLATMFSSTSGTKSAN